MAVKFKEDGHKYYTLDGERELVSVSGLMHRFEKQKDWTAIAEKSSRNLKRYQNIIKSPQTLMAEWEMKRVKGSQAGTMVHKLKEQQLLGRRDQIRIVESPTDKEYKYALPVGELENNTVYPELMIYDLDYGVCGQSDEVEIKDDYIIVRDHKTDKSIEMRGFSSPYTPPEMYLAPLSHLEVCNYNTYSLKMSLYMYLIWKANGGRFKPGEIVLNWCPIDRDQDGIPILYNDDGDIVEDGGTPRILFEQEILVPYRKDEVIAMLDTLKKKPKTN